VKDIEARAKDAPRKHSLMLPNGSSIIDSKGSGTSSSVVGGMDNYKRYQMLVQQQAGLQSAQTTGGGYKRSNSLNMNAAAASGSATKPK